MVLDVTGDSDGHLTSKDKDEVAFSLALFARSHSLSLSVSRFDCYTCASESTPLLLSPCSHAVQDRNLTPNPLPPEQDKFDATKHYE